MDIPRIIWYKKIRYIKILSKAFQRRFRQELVNGIIDKECLKISENTFKKKNLIFIINSPNNPSGTICKNLKDIAHATRPFFFELDGYDEKGVKKFLNESLETLTFALEVLSKLTEWNETELDMALIKVRDYFNLPIPKVNQPMRIALVGSTVSPSLGLTLELFGKEKSLERIQKAIDFIS